MADLQESRLEQRRGIGGKVPVRGGSDAPLCSACHQIHNRYDRWLGDSRFSHGRRCSEGGIKPEMLPCWGVFLLPFPIGNYIYLFSALYAILRKMGCQVNPTANYSLSALIVLGNIFGFIFSAQQKEKKHRADHCEGRVRQFTPGVEAEHGKCR